MARRGRRDTTAAGGGLRCSFCNKSQLEVLKLVAGPGVYICNECVDLCTQIVAVELGRKDRRAPGPGRSSTSGALPNIRGWDELSDDALLAETVRAHAAHASVDRSVAIHVAELRARGLTWARIGEALGMTRQSAWERFSDEE